MGEERRGPREEAGGGGRAGGQDELDSVVQPHRLTGARVHERSKHIDVAYHNIRDLHKRNQIWVDFVPSQEMVANGLTKPLPGRIFEWFIELLGLTASS